MNNKILPFNATFTEIIKDDENYFDQYLLEQQYFPTWLENIYPFPIKSTKTGTKDEHTRKSKVFHIFPNEWRKPLEIKEILVFKVMASISTGFNFHCMEHVSYLTRSEVSLFKKIIAKLEEEGYVKVKRKYKKVNMRIQAISSAIYYVCLNPEGKAVSRKELYNYHYKCIVEKSKIKKELKNSE